MGIEIQVSWQAFNRAVHAARTEGDTLPIRHEYFCSQYNIIDVRNGPEADFMIDFETEHDATMFLLRWA